MELTSVDSSKENGRLWIEKMENSSNWLQEVERENCRWPPSGTEHNGIVKQIKFSLSFLKFSLIDLASGFHQVEMEPLSTEKTAFSTDNGHFEFFENAIWVKE